jgi:hypothetical protein
MSHDLSAKPLAWYLCTSLGPHQLLITVLVIIDIQIGWCHIGPSCLTQAFTIVHITLASLKEQDKVVKHKAATYKHECPFLVFHQRNLDAELTKCLKSTFEQHVRMLSTYSDLYSWLVTLSYQTAYIHAFNMK